MQKFEMVAKTLMGLEQVLAEELRALGAENVEPGRRMVSFWGDTEMLYKANLCCRTALRILKPFYKFEAHTPDELYEMAKEYDWSTILSLDKTFCIDTVAYSEDFTHSHFVTYRVKDAICDWFRDHCDDKRPGVRLSDADIMINVHISGGNVTFSLDSSGESLHKRGYRVAQTEAPINEVLAAGIILMSGWRGDVPFVDPMCGSGTFLIEAALIAANINPGVYRKSFAFEQWPDFDRDLFDRLYNDDSQERPVTCPIIGADISQAALDIATRNVKSAGVGKYVTLERKPLAHWEDSPKPAGVLITNPPYGERISSNDMEGLYAMLGNRLKFAFQGYHAWIIGYRDEYFIKIGLSPSQKIPVLNGQLECELREYIIFDGDKKSFLAGGGKLKTDRPRNDDRPRRRDDREHKDHDHRDRKDRNNRFTSRRDDRERGDRFEKRERNGSFDRKDKFDRNVGMHHGASSPEQEQPSENPLALRRNPNALKMLKNRQPSLPPTEVTMRKRGWRKKDDQD